MPFLETNFPALAANYRERYQGRSFLPPAYGKRLSQLMSHLREKCSLGQRDREQPPAYASKLPVEGFNEQLELF
jgi:hypothetical protein